METQNFLFFSLWYGVYCAGTRELCFGSGGHPPAVLLRPRAPGAIELRLLRTEGPAVGCFPEARFTDAVETVPRGSRLLVFSDGAFEIFGENEQAGTWEQFAAELETPEVQRLRPTERLERALRRRNAPSLEDDFSFLELRIQPD